MPGTLIWLVKMPESNKHQQFYSIDASFFYKYFGTIFLYSWCQQQDGGMEKTGYNYESIRNFVLKLYYCTTIGDAIT